MAELAEQFRGYGGKVLRTTLSPQAATKLQELMTPVTAGAALSRPVLTTTGGVR